MKILVLKPNGGYIGFHMGVIQELVNGGYYPEKIIGSSSGAIAGFFAARRINPVSFFLSFLEKQEPYTSPFLKAGKFSTRKTLHYLAGKLHWSDIGLLFYASQRKQWVQRISVPAGFAALSIADFLLSVSQSHPLQIPFVIGLTTPTGECELMEFLPGCDEEFLVDIVCQSAQYPILDPHPHGIYTDGGLSSQNPAVPYLQQNPTENNHYLVSDPQGLVKPPSRRKVLYQLDALQMIERSLDRTEERLFVGIPHLRLNPVLSFSRYDFSAETQRQLVEIGSAEMRKLTPQLRAEWQSPLSQ